MYQTTTCRGKDSATLYDIFADSVDYYFDLILGFLRLCQFWWLSTKKCDCESAHRL